MNITKSQTTTSERLSALADGELDNAELLLLLESCQTDDAAVGKWSAYHVIGDAMRSPSLAVGRRSPDFLQRLNERIEEERAHVGVAPVFSPLKVLHRESAANDSIFRWKLAAGFASLAAVSAIAWSSFGLVSSPSPAQLAQAPMAAQTTPQILVVASPQGPVVRDARLEELLAAHRQLGSATALQAPSGFLNAAFETPQNAGR